MWGPPLLWQHASGRHAAQELPYGKLMEELDIATVRELEDMVIECTYQNMLSAKLDQKRALVDVEYASARDISPADVQKMIEQLTAWNRTCDTTIQKLQEKIEAADQRFMLSQARDVAHEKEFDAHVAAFKVVMMLLFLVFLSSFCLVMTAVNMDDRCCALHHRSNRMLLHAMVWMTGLRVDSWVAMAVGAVAIHRHPSVVPELCFYFCL
jgi:hypothetical protein